MKTIAVVGASLAGFSTAQQLRAQGFGGRLVMVGEETQLPYDRPPLSKDFLTGELDTDDLALADQSDVAELDAVWVLGQRAVALEQPAALDGNAPGVRLSGGGTVRADGVVLATGARPRLLPGSEELAGVHRLRTVADAAALRAGLRTGHPKVVIVGGGFIGAEVASSCRELGLDVTVVDGSPQPLEPVLGAGMAEVCAELQAEHGVRQRFGVGVTELLGDGKRVRGVLLADGERLDADVVLLAIGVRPNTEWLTDSGLPLGDGVLCDSGCMTSNPAVVAVGDLAAVYDTRRDVRVRTEHWTNATQQAATAARNLLAGQLVEQFRAVPYFWSDQYRVRVQFAGHPLPTDEVEIVEGETAQRRFLASYTRDGQPVGALAFNNPRSFARARRALAPPAVAA